MKKRNESLTFAMGAPVQWKWLGRIINGSVREIHREPISKIIKGKEIKRNGSAANPAYVVESDAGNLALKLHSELQSPEPSSLKAASPRMFRR